MPQGQLTLALLVSLISVISAIVPPVLRYFTNHSQTYIRVLGDGTFRAEGEGRPDRTIKVLAANNGKRSSIVESASIRFAGIGAAPAVLEIRNLDQTLILPEKQVVLHLSADHIGRVGTATREEILAAVERGRATITLNVEETGIDGHFFSATPAHTINTDRIYEWMDAHVSSAQ